MRVDRCQLAITPRNLRRTVTEQNGSVSRHLRLSQRKVESNAERSQVEKVDRRGKGFSDSQLEGIVLGMIGLGQRRRS